MKRWFVGAKKYPLILSAVVVVLFVAGGLLLNGRELPVLMPSGAIAEQQQDLILFTVVLSATVVVPVFFMLGLFAWKYRDGNKSADYNPEWKENGRLEALWWGIPIIIIAVLSVVTWQTSHSLDPYRQIESDKHPLVVQVVALQWKWLFIYPEQGLATVNDLTIPVDRPVTFRLSADAPMSAFWVPALGSQIYSMNAMTSQLNLIADEPGTYTGYNTNINGEGYADMTFDVNAVNDTTFATWSDGRAKSSDVLTLARLEELSQPGVPEEPLYLKLDDKNIYDSVIAKYMNHGSDTGEADHATMESMDMSGGGE